MKDTEPNSYVIRHLKFGWCCILGFVVLGLVLDYFHAFKVGWYLNVGNETRRLMGTLAHAHGTLLGGLNIAYAATLYVVGDRLLGKAKFTSACLMSATLLMPLGFLLAGLFTLKDEPGFAVFLVPIGGLLLLISLGLTVSSLLGLSARREPEKVAKTNKRKK